MTHYKQSPEGRGRLGDLGWDEHFEHILESMTFCPGGLARVIGVQRGLFGVTNGQEEWLCAPAGRVRGAATGVYPVTGDWVLASEKTLYAVVPRKNILVRGEAGSRGNRMGGAIRQQAIAANLDTVLIVCGLDRDFNLRRIERYLTLVYNCGIHPVLVLTKADLHPDPEVFRYTVETIALGVPVVLASAQDGRGLAELEPCLAPGRSVAMLGSSGAGKSTLANRLAGREIRKTASVSERVGKGRHTTTTRELIRMPQGGLLMDNPGMREIAFCDEGEGVASTFADIQDLSRRCRFADCAHAHEPGCAVRHAVETGELRPERLESYHKMKREMTYLGERQIKSAERIEKERWREIAGLRRLIKHRKG